MTGDERFEELFRANYGDVLAYAVRRCPTRQDAEDVVAETFSVAWRRLDELPAGERARLWLFGTARLVRMNQRREHRRRDGLLVRLRTLTPAPSPDEIAEQSTAAGQLAAALGQLPERDREVLQLHVWEQLSAEQIGQVLEVSTPAVWKRLQRARDRLGALLDDDTTNPGWAVTPTTGKATR